jgi:DNA repair photolyase
MAEIRINPDGCSIMGCDLIYAPAGQAGEYAKLAANPYRGCGNCCVYCYVPGVLKMTREEFDAGAVDRENFLKRLPRQAAKYQAAGITEQVLLSFTTDPYHPFDTTLTRQTIEILREHGLGFCTLTKGGSRALRDIDLFRPERDAFASTLTCLDPKASLKWERQAALPADRIATLKAFHDAGIYTWVSIEPVLDTETALEIIEQTSEFVDLFKIGRINYSKLTKVTDWGEFTRRVVGLLKRIKSDYYIKQDLQPFLPPEFRNVKYREQRRSLPIVGQ